MENNITVQNESPGRRAAAYWFVDGLPEMVFGFSLLVWGAWGMAWEELHWQNWWMRAVCLAAGLLFYALLFLYRRILDSLKARITYPRTGYARPPILYTRFSEPDGKILTLGTVHAADENISWFRGHTVSLFIFGFIFVSFFETRWSLASAMAVITAGVYFLNRDDVRSYSWHSVLPIALAGFVAAGLDLAPQSRQFVTLVIGGAWLLGIGTWTLVRYLRAHPKSVAVREVRP